MIAPPTTADDLIALLLAEEPVGEADGTAPEVLTALDHHLQCAAVLAAERPDDLELQVAGLVHDVGHLAVPDDPDAHGRAGADLVRPLLGSRVADLVELHVPAKRYLVTVDPAYRSRLSANSTWTLSQQGGDLSDDERVVFEQHPRADDALALRRADEAAKVAGRVVEGLDGWRPAIEQVARETRVMRDRIDRFLSALARLVLHGFYRDVETEGWDELPRDRPFLVVANHFNGFVDPALLVVLAGRTPRFLAKASLWKVTAARPFLALAGILPVARPEDGAGTAGNDSTFDSCHDALREGEVVALFPEGTTHDAERLDKIRTGAARIALGARAAGVADIVIVPIGIKFENKVALRSRALARVGQPIDLDAVIAQLVEPGAPADDSNHEAVDRLTDLIADRLRQVSPTYRDWEQAASLSLAAEVALRTKATNYRQEVSLADREDLAQRLAFLDEPTQVEIIDALAAYTFGLDLLGLRDDQVVPGYHAEALTEHVVWSGVRLAALAPATVAGTALNILPYWVVKGASMRVQVPVTKGTVRILASMVAFPLNWIVTAVIVDRRRGRTAAVATLFGAPVFGFAAVYAFERWSNLRHAWKGWQRVSEERSRLGPVLERRAALVALVEKAIGEDIAGDQVPAIDPVEVVEARANEDVFGAAG